MVAFNRVSQIKRSVAVTVTEILCDYPTVSLEKQPTNSIASPRQIFSFLEFRLYTSIKIECDITSLTEMTWWAFEMIESLPDSILSDSITDILSGEYVTLPKSAERFSSPFYKYKPISGLSYTSKSEDITFEPRFFNLGLHLICVNVAMFNVPGLNATDCIYVNNVLPPLVVGINYGVRRSVRHGDILVMDATSASYDPDSQTLAQVQSPTYNASSSGLTFRMSCPFLVKKDSADQFSSDEKLLMFEENQGLFYFNTLLFRINLKHRT